MVMAVSNTSVTENVLTTSNFTVETTTLLNNLTTMLTNLANGNTSLISESEGSSNATSVLQQAMLPEDDIHKNPELKYFSTVIIIFLGLTILIVPVFCFIGVVCARARIFKTVREAAGRGWGFGDLNVPYAEFGSAEDYTKADIAPTTAASSNSGSTQCDVKILVADDNRVPSSSQNVRKNSFLRVHNDEDDDISSLPPTFVRNPV